MTSVAVTTSCSSPFYRCVSVKHCGVPAVSSSYLLSHGYASWGNDDISTADAFIQSIEKVIGAVEHKEACVGKLTYSYK